MCDPYNASSVPEHPPNNNSNGNTRSTANTNGNGNNSTYSSLEANNIMNLSVPSVSGGQIVAGQHLAQLDEVRVNSTDIFGPSYTEAYEPTERITGEPEQYQRIEQALFDLLDAFNVNWEDPNYTETPKRVAKAYLEFWASGYGRTAEEEITVFPNASGKDDMVMVKDMRFYSLCSHHLAPFTGYAAIAYIADEHLLGLSKLGRILDIYARRFQLQERIGAQTADKLMELIRPKGVMIVLYDVEHLCMSSRGVKLHEANTTTLATRGIFKDNYERRSEVLSLLGKR